jgi:hypothetical protein
VLLIGAYAECAAPPSRTTPSSAPSVTITASPTPEAVCPVDLERLNKLIRIENTVAKASFRADTVKEFIRVRQARAKVWERLVVLFVNVPQTLLLAERNAKATSRAYAALVLGDYGGDTHWTRVANRLDERINLSIDAIRASCAFIDG